MCFLQIIIFSINVNFLGSNHLVLNHTISVRKLIYLLDAQQIGSTTFPAEKLQGIMALLPNGLVPLVEMLLLMEEIRLTT